MAITCKKCGGIVRLDNGRAVCENCQNEYNFDPVYENTEVLVCCVENDAMGRRTKDGIVAQEIYTKLSAKRITTFYERVSAANFVGDDLEMLRYATAFRAKVIVFVGAVEAHFNTLLEQYAEFLDDKTVIPFCVDMNPALLPGALKKIQSISYSSIGWEKDLTGVLFELLGREEEPGLDALYKKKTATRKAILVSVACVLVVLLGLCMAIVIQRVQKKKEPAPLTNQEMYNAAVALYDEGKYMAALGEFKKVQQFKDSKTYVAAIYDRYDGYYLSDDKKTSFFINIQDGSGVTLSCERKLADGLAKFEVESKVTDNRIVESFLDNTNARGTVEVTLNDAGFHLKIESALFDNLETDFSLSQRTDAPELKTITHEDVVSWLTNRKTEEQLNLDGWELSSGLEIVSVGNVPVKEMKVYDIDNTDVRVFLSMCDESKIVHSDNRDDEKNQLEDYAVISVIAPAYIVCPDKIGKAALPFRDDKMAYIPNAAYFYLDAESYVFTADDNLEGWNYVRNSIPSFRYDLDKSNDYVIEESTLVGVTSKALLGKENFDAMFHLYEKDDSLMGLRAMRLFEDVFPSCKNETLMDKLLASTDEDDLVLVYAWSGQHLFCVWHKSDGTLKKIESGTIDVDSVIAGGTAGTSGDQEDYYEAYVKNHPQTFAEFLRQDGSLKKNGKTKDALNVRMGPGKDYEKIGLLSKGTTVEILDEINRFYLIKYNWTKDGQSGTTAYVSRDYVEIIQ